MKLQEIMKKIEKSNSILSEFYGKDKLALSNNYVGIVATFSEFKKALHNTYIPAAEKAILDADFDCFNGVFNASYSADGKSSYNINFCIVEI